MRQYYVLKAIVDNALDRLNTETIIREQVHNKQTIRFDDYANRNKQDNYTIYYIIFCDFFYGLGMNFANKDDAQSVLDWVKENAPILIGRNKEVKEAVFSYEEMIDEYSDEFIEI